MFSKEIDDLRINMCSSNEPIESHKDALTELLAKMDKELDEFQKRFWHLELNTGSPPWR